MNGCMKTWTGASYGDEEEGKLSTLAQYEATWVCSCSGQM